MQRKNRDKSKMLPNNQAWFRDGALASWPICFGYIPIGLALGVLANQAGIPVWAVTMMSVLVFAGSAQFICVAMLAAGASIWAIIFTTFVVNLRHFLMSSAVAVHLSCLRRRFLSFFAYGITDESFAVNMTHFREGNWDHRRAITVNQLANLAWVAPRHARNILFGGAFFSVHYRHSWSLMVQRPGMSSMLHRNG